MPTSRLTVISPCLNEEAVIRRFVEIVGDVLAQVPDIRYRLLLVDDGSKDATAAVVDELRIGRPWLEHLVFTRNFGHQTALSAGLEHARGEAVILMDSDLQHPPALIPEMIARWREGHDVVSAVRTHTVGAGRIKQLSSGIFYRIFNRMSETRITAGAADFCLLSRRVRLSLVKMPERHRFLRGMIAWLGYPRCEVPYIAGDRAAGVSKYPLRRMVALAIDAVVSFSVRPLRLAIRLGLFSVVIGMGYLGFVILSFLRGNTLSGWASIIACILVMGGTQLVVLGIMSEYLARQTELLRGRPLYVVRQRSHAVWAESGGR